LAGPPPVLTQRIQVPNKLATSPIRISKLRRPRTHVQLTGFEGNPLTELPHAHTSFSPAVYQGARTLHIPFLDVHLDQTALTSRAGGEELKTLTKKLECSSRVALIGCDE
jgi:hypothetical protein